MTEPAKRISPESIDSPATGRHRLRSVLGSVLLVTGVFFLNFGARVGMAPLMPAIERDLGIGHGAAGTVFLFLSLGICLGLLGSALVTPHLTHRRTVVSSALAAGAALLATALGTGISSLCWGMAAVGLAAGLYLPSGVATITSLVAPADWGKALAVHELAPNLSFLAAPLLVEALLRWLPWRGVVAVFGLAVIAGGMAFARFGRGGEIRESPLRGAALQAALGKPALWGLMVLFCLAFGGQMGVYNMLPLYLVSEAGFARPVANGLLAGSRATALITILLAGWLGDRLGPRRTMSVVFAAGGLFTALLAVTSGPWFVLVVFLQPMLASAFFPVGFAALSRIHPLAISLAIPVAILVGGGAIPAGMGVLADAGAFRHSMGLLGGLVGTGAALAWLVPVPRNSGGE